MKTSKHNFNSFAYPKNVLFFICQVVAIYIASTIFSYSSLEGTNNASVEVNWNSKVTPAVKGQTLNRKCTQSRPFLIFLSVTWTLSAVPTPWCHAGSWMLLPLRGPQTYQAFSWDAAAAGQCAEATACARACLVSAKALNSFPSATAGNRRTLPEMSNC